MRTVVPVMKRDLHKDIIQQRMKFTDRLMQFTAWMIILLTFTFLLLSKE